ncbi:MAG: DUF2809 domain-containing protein [Oscillospiraceae bacterium]|nr:DUF2809 domain-containing protein [Oscillospiraceae bacterium]
MNKRTLYLIASVVLLGVEILIGMFAEGWLRIYFGDVLVIILLYTLVRTVLPKIRFCGLLPTLLLIFCQMVEGLQAWGFADRMGITNALLRILIGTSFAWGDVLSYCIGFVPILLWEILSKKSAQQ